MTPGSARTDRLHGVEREPGGEHAEVVQQLALLVGKQAHAPVDRRAHGPVPLGQVACGSGQQGEAAAQSLRDPRRGEDAHLRRRELDGERESLQAPADVGDVGGVLLGHDETGLGGLGAVDEQRAR